MSDVAKLKADLHALNSRIQAERNDEVRQGLQRTKLENERAELLAKIMDAQAVSAAVPTTPAIVGKISREPTARSQQKRKPDGLPSMSAMIITALQVSGKAQRPAEIATYVRQRWWPTAPSRVIGTQAWQMAKLGKLIARDGLYGLNGVEH